MTVTCFSHRTEQPISPDSLIVRHSFGEVLLSSYRTNSSDEGITIHRRLRLGSRTQERISVRRTGAWRCTASLRGRFPRTERRNARHWARDSVTAIPPKTRSAKKSPAGVLSIETDAAAVLFESPIRSGKSFGIAGSATRLASGVLYLSEGLFISAGADGITHYGNTYLAGDVTSARFTPGLAGTGWGVQRSAATGNAAATFDELTVRKRMRIYELEIQKTDVVGGALWISHASAATRSREYTDGKGRLSDIQDPPGPALEEGAEPCSRGMWCGVRIMMLRGRSIR